MTKITDLTGAAPDSADVIPYVDLSDTTEDAAGTAKKATVAQIVAAGVDTSTLLPKAAGGGEALTGTLYLDPGADDAATLARVPVTSSNNGDILLNVGRAAFNGTEDVVFNLGFNQAAGGSAVDAALHRWYLQMEYDYNDGGGRWCEFHLNLAPAGGDILRPVEFKFERDGSEGTISWRCTTWTVQDLDGANTVFSLSEVGTVNAAVKLRNVAQIIPIDSTTVEGWVITGPSYNLDTITAGNEVRVFRGNTFFFRNDSDATIFQLDNTASGGFGMIRHFTRTQIIASQAQHFALNVRGASSHTGNLIQAENSATAVQWAIGPTGQIKTNQASANTATPSGATAYQLPIYNAAGTLLGYIPVYGSAWT